MMKRHFLSTGKFSPRGRPILPCALLALLVSAGLPSAAADTCGDAFSAELSLMPSTHPTVLPSTEDQAGKLALELRDGADRAGIQLMDYLQSPAVRKAIADASREDATFLKRLKAAIQMLPNRNSQKAEEQSKRPKKENQKVLVKGDFESIEVLTTFTGDNIVELPNGYLIVERRLFETQVLFPSVDLRAFVRFNEFPKNIHKMRLLDQTRFVALEADGNKQYLVFGQVSDLTEIPGLQGTRSSVLLDTLEESKKGKGYIVDISPLSNGSVVTTLSDGTFRVYYPDYQRRGYQMYGPAHSLSLNNEFSYSGPAVELPSGDLVTTNVFGTGQDTRNFMTRWRINPQTGQYSQVEFLQSSLTDRVWSLILLKDGSIAASTFDTGRILIFTEDPTTGRWHERQRIELEKGVVYDLKELPDGQLIANTRGGGFAIIELLPPNQHRVVQTLEGHPKDISGGRNTMHVFPDGRILTLTGPMVNSSKVLLWERGLKEYDMDQDAP